MLTSFPSLSNDAKITVPVLSVSDFITASFELLSYSIPSDTSGEAVGFTLGSGVSVGFAVGSGVSVGFTVGSGVSVGFAVGSGVSVGFTVGSGVSVGFAVGSGVSVGFVITESVSLLTDILSICVIRVPPSYLGERT